MPKGNKQQRSKPLPADMNRGLRRFVRGAVNVLMHIIFRMKYVNKEKLLQEGPVMLISNHSSFLDIPAIHVNVKPWIFFVAKEELFQARLAGAFLRWWGAIAVNREKTTLSSAREILGRLNEKAIVSIFPEGTRIPKGSDYRDYLPKVGVLHFAKRSGAMIQPMAVDVKFRFRGLITVTVGDPFSFDDLRQGVDGPRSDEEMVIEMMRRVYRLNGMDYLPELANG